MRLVEEVTKRFTLQDLGEEEIPEQFLLRLSDYQDMGWELVELSWVRDEPSIVMRQRRRYHYSSEAEGETLGRGM